jgi:hypothetical protein
MKQHSLILTMAMASVLTACGGGGGGYNAGTTPGGTTPGTTPGTSASTAVAQGTVTGFGSVIVNGVHFDVKDAAIDVDGEAHVESDLAVGQTVSITGTVDADGIHGKAKKLSAETQLRGPIDSIDLVNGVIVTLGQSIRITADTFYEDGHTAASLKVGDVIKVSSNTNAAGNLVATRIEVKTGSEAKDLFLSGAVADLNTTAMTFTINGTTVDYSKATLADLPSKTISNGMLVRVHGKVINSIFVANGNVHSSILDIKHDDELDSKINLEVGGLVANLVPSTSFTLHDTKVLISSSTTFVNGLVTDLSNSLQVRVKGKLDADHNLMAEKITLIFKAKVDDEGLVQATDLTKNTFTLNGVVFEVTVDTSVNDRSKAKVRLFSLKDLVTGDYIDVRGYKVAATTSTPERIIATRVERKDASENDDNEFDSDISGKVESVSGDMIKISGHNIKVTDHTELKGFLNLQAFLSSAVGLSVEVHGVVENDVFIARKIAVDNGGDGEHESHHSDSKSSSSAKSSSSSELSSSSKSSSSSSAAK